MQAELKQVIYISEKTDFSDHCLTKIFDTSEKKNPEKGISGCLLIGSNSYLQFLEGPLEIGDRNYFQSASILICPFPDFFSLKYQKFLSNSGQRNLFFQKYK